MKQGEPLKVRDAGDALVAAAREADELVQRLRRELDESAGIDPALLQVFGEWLDRVGRLSKVTLEAGVAERRVRLVEQQADLIVMILQGIAADLGLTDGQRAVFPQIAEKWLMIADGKTIQGEIESGVA